MLKQIHAINNLKNHKKYWDETISYEGEMTPFNIELFQKVVSDKNAVILDVGCGYGRTLNEIYKIGYHNLVGVDIASQMVERGKKAYPFLNLISYDGNLTKFFQPDTFDVVILLGVFTCIAEDSLQQELISQIFSLLKRKGIIYVNDFLLNTDERNITRYNKLQKKLEGYPYGVFELKEDLLFRHQNIEGINKLFSPFEHLYFIEKKFKTLHQHIGNGFIFVGKKK